MKDGAATFVLMAFDTCQVNAMDSTSLAFIMPLLLRGLTSPSYELTKKAAVASGNVCALVKEASTIVPFVPSLSPALAKLQARRDRG